MQLLWHNDFMNNPNSTLFSQEYVKKLSHLARIALSDVEIKQITHDLEQLNQYISCLAKVDTQHVEPLYTPFEPPFATPNRLRDDTAVSHPEKITQHTPHVLYDNYKVPACMAD
jgi:aspartyl/glutamyl-tRNA(Asn/Gln) amidotransferase C subunit